MTYMGPKLTYMGLKLTNKGRRLSYMGLKLSYMGRVRKRHLLERNMCNSVGTFG